MPELRTARENARLEIGSQRGRNSHRIIFWATAIVQCRVHEAVRPARARAGGAVSGHITCSVRVR